MLRIEAKSAGRLDRVLRESEIAGAEWLSRASWDFLFKQGLIRDIWGKRLAPGVEWTVREPVEIALPGPLEGIRKAEKSLSPLWEGEGMALFAKPPGIASYPLYPWETEAFANRVATWLEEAGRMSARDFSLLAKPPLLEGGLVQRLDRGTSGALLVALNPKKKAKLRAEFQAKRVKKSYLAVAHGKPAFQKKDLRLHTWPENEKRMAAGMSPKGDLSREVTLSLGVLSTHADATLFSVETTHGTRHVVRVALATLGHPLWGDRLYGKSDIFSEHLLHASKIEVKGFPIPKVPPPQSFMDCLASLGLAYQDEG